MGRYIGGATIYLQDELNFSNDLNVTLSKGIISVPYSMEGSATRVHSVYANELLSGPLLDMEKTLAI